MIAPANTGSGASARLSCRSALVVTFVWRGAVLLAVFWSGSTALILAVLVKTPVVDEGTLPEIETVPEALGFRLPRLQVITPRLRLQVPCEGVTEPKVNPAGKLSVNVTPVAVDGPALEKLIV